MAGEILRSNLKAIFFLVFFKLWRHPGSQFLGKFYGIQITENRFMIAGLFFGQFTACLAAILLQKCLEMLFVEFRRPSSARRVIDVKIAVFEFCKLFSCCRLVDDTFLYVANLPGSFSSFLISMKSERAGVENVDLYLLDVPFLSIHRLNSNKQND